MTEEERVIVRKAKETINALVRPMIPLLDKEKALYVEEALHMIDNYHGSVWIPITTRKLTDEECEYWGDSADSDSWTYDCPLPEDGQEVLVTTMSGDVHETVFGYYDEVCWFENYEDREDITAWMPKPEGWKGLNE